MIKICPCSGIEELKNRFSTCKQSWGYHVVVRAPFMPLTEKKPVCRYLKAELLEGTAGES